MSGGVMTGTAYNVALKGFCPLPWPWCRIVRRVVVESTLPIEPVRRETRCTTTMSRRQDGTVLVKARLGGVMASSVGMSTRLRSLCADTLADGLWLEQGSYEYPFSPDTAAERVLALRRDGVRQAQGTGGAHMARRGELWRMLRGGRSDCGGRPIARCRKRLFTSKHDSDFDRQCR